MLVSHSHKFIFIKPKKVAGTSIQLYLARFCKDGLVYARDPKSHMKAASVRKLVGEKVWNSYLKVTATRNPWDKTVSLYYWRRRKRPFYIYLKRMLVGKPMYSLAVRFSFKEFVKELLKLGVLNEDKSITHVDGKLPDYHFIRFEHIHADLENLCEKIGETYNPDDMPQKKVGHRKDRSYQDHFDEETKECVQMAYDDEIKLFGYTY
ncbi:MAG: hypothetical protein ACJA08_002024 [Cyclobacteriaceae bacterium]|jgi:hypothetical protein